MTAQALFHEVAGETELAIAALEEARAIAARTGMYFYESETIRHLARLQPTAEARTAGLREALALAQRQGALIYELNAAVDLARFDGDVTELTRVLGEFSPSLSYPALDEARALVSELTGSR
jgi:hypothetical protein